MSVDKQRYYNFRSRSNSSSLQSSIKAGKMSTKSSVSSSKSTPGLQQQRPRIRSSPGGNLSHVTASPALSSVPESTDNDNAHSDLSQVMDRMNSLFQQLSDQMNGKFDLIIEDISTIKRELRETKGAVMELETSVNINEAKLKEIEKDTIPKLKDELAKKNQALEEKIMLLELHDRKQNLLIYGVNEARGENIYSTVRDVIAHFLSPQTAANMNMYAHRLPQPPHTNDKSTPRPIIVRFGNIRDRDELLSAFEQPRRKPDQAMHRNAPPTSVSTSQSTPSANDTLQSGQEPSTPEAATAPVTRYDRVTIRSDLPPVMKRERGRLASLAFKLRKEKHVATRIRISGTRVFLQTRPKPGINGTPAAWKIWNE